MRKLNIFRLGWHNFKKLPKETLTPVIESAFAPIVTVVCVHEERYTGITNCLGGTVQDGQDKTVKVANQPKKRSFRIYTNRIWKVSFKSFYFDLDMDYQLQFHLSIQWHILACPDNVISRTKDKRGVLYQLSVVCTLIDHRKCWLAFPLETWIFQDDINKCFILVHTTENLCQFHNYK